MYDGSRLLGTVLVDQRSAPTGLVDLEADWKLLDYRGNGGVFRVKGKTLVVKLTDKANGSVLADAVRIERIYFPSGLGGFFPYFASYSAANWASSFGLQRKHCDFGRSCALHQSPFC